MRQHLLMHQGKRVDLLSSQDHWVNFVIRPYGHPTLNQPCVRYCLNEGGVIQVYSFDFRVRVQIEYLHLLNCASSLGQLTKSSAWSLGSENYSSYFPNAPKGRVKVFRHLHNSGGRFGNFFSFGLCAHIKRLFHTLPPCV